MFEEWFLLIILTHCFPSSYESCHNLFVRMRKLFHYIHRAHCLQVKRHSAHRLNFVHNQEQIHNRRKNFLVALCYLILWDWFDYSLNLLLPHSRSLKDKHRTTSIHLFVIHGAASYHYLYGFRHSRKLKFVNKYIITIISKNLHFYSISNIDH